jgi:Sulfate permease family
LASFQLVAGYRRAWLRPDLLAGLTVWAVLVAESLAYASIAGLPPVVGLYAAVPALPSMRWRQLSSPDRRAYVGDGRIVIGDHHAGCSR